MALHIGQGGRLELKSKAATVSCVDGSRARVSTTNIELWHTCSDRLLNRHNFCSVTM